MRVTPCPTPVIQQNESLETICYTYLPPLKERTILCVTSKIVSICEGRTVSRESTDKQTLIQQEAEAWLLEEGTMTSRFPLTIIHNLLIPAAGIDESNSQEGGFILYPLDPFASAEKLWRHLREHFQINQLGVIFSDSHTTPLRRGTIGIALSWCGFKPFKDYRGQSDLFGRLLQVTTVNVVDGLAAACVLMMGEGDEGIPLAVIEDLEDIVFLDVPPSEEDRKDLLISPSEDIYASLLRAAQWGRGL